MKNVYDVIVIGSGPAGFTAGIYSARGAAITALFAGERWGGQLMLTTLVENYPGFPDGIQGPDLMMAMRKQTENAGVSIVNESVSKVNFSNKPYEVTAGEKTYKAKSIIIATGAETNWLGVKGEDKLIGRGISSCAPCDAPFFKGKHVAVIGGGDSAMEEALVLTKFASEVTIIHRKNEFRASKFMQNKVLNNPKIKIIWNTEVVEMVGTEKLEKLVLKDNKENKTYDFVVDGCFVAIGHSPSSKVFMGGIEVDEKGYIKRISKEGYSTSTNVDGVFVAGDVHDFHYKQAVTAAAYGCMAALEALKYLDS